MCEGGKFQKDYFEINSDNSNLYHQLSSKDEISANFGGFGINNESVPIKLRVVKK